MTPTELRALFRSEVFDLELPYLWSDTLVYSYIDEAQKQFCRDTYGVADARSFKLNILADGTEWYPTDPRILKVRTAVNAATGVPLAFIPVEKMADYQMKFDGGKGPLKAMISGLENHMLRAWPVPNQATTVDLTTFRLPSDVAAGDDFEVDPQHHRYLLYWVKHLAYDVQDTEVFNPKAADKNRALHEAYCIKAKHEMSRAMHPVSNVTYGGI